MERKVLARHSEGTIRFSSAIRDGGPESNVNTSPSTTNFCFVLVGFCSRGLNQTVSPENGGPNRRA